MDESLKAKYLSVLRKGYHERELVHGWEPPDINSDIIQWAVKEGYLRITDARSGFELMKNSFVVWTDAGKYVMIAMGPYT